MPIIIGFGVPGFILSCRFPLLFNYMMQAKFSCPRTGGEIQQALALYGA